MTETRSARKSASAGEDSGAFTTEKKRKPAVFWSMEDEIALIELMKENSHQGAADWEQIMLGIQKRPYSGSQKTMTACKEKWRRLKYKFNNVATLKFKTSGMSYTSEQGMRVCQKDGVDPDVWDDFSSNPSKIDFGNTGFVHFELMASFIRPTARGNAYAPSGGRYHRDESISTMDVDAPVASMPRSTAPPEISSAASAGRSEGFVVPQTPSLATPNTLQRPSLPSAPSVSVSMTSSSKRTFSGMSGSPLDSIQGRGASVGSSKKQKVSQNTEVLNRIQESMSQFNVIMQENKDRQIAVSSALENSRKQAPDAYKNAEAALRSALSMHKALLSSDQFVILSDIFYKDPKHASAYLVMVESAAPDVCQAWVCKKLGITNPDEEADNAVALDSD